MDRQPAGDVPRTAWRFFPWFVAGALGVVAVVNGVMMYLAVGTFPGLASANGFAASNGYDRVMAAAERQAALGWRVRAEVNGAHVVVVLTAQDGAALDGVRVRAVAERPVGAPETIELVFHPAGPGRWEATQTLAPGQWDIDVTVTAPGAEYHSQQRIVAR